MIHRAVDAELCNASLAGDSSPMPIVANGNLRTIALRVLAQRGAAENAEGLASAVRSAYRDLDRVSVPLLGQDGVDALADHAVTLAQRDYPWLAPPQPQDRSEAFSRFIPCLHQQGATVAMDAAAAVFAILARLLVTFIGAPLTSHLLRNAWPDALSDVPANGSGQ